jgi:hypothetical protein
MQGIKRANTSEEQAQPKRQRAIFQSKFKSEDDPMASLLKPKKSEQLSDMGWEAESHITKTGRSVRLSIPYDAGEDDSTADTRIVNSAVETFKRQLETVADVPASYRGHLIHQATRSFKRAIESQMSKKRTTAGSDYGEESGPTSSILVTQAVADIFSLLSLATR